MSIELLLAEASVRPSTGLGRIAGPAVKFSDFTYLLWDMTPEAGWLPVEHPKRTIVREGQYRPIYLGKATSWGGVFRHVSKDSFGCGASTPSDKNAINEGLLAYCLSKTSPNWLGLSFVEHEDGVSAQKLEQEGVSRLGWRRDVKARKLFKKGDIAAAKGAGRAAWGEALSRLYKHHSPAIQAPTPMGQGILFNQMDPITDSRGQRSPLTG